jgi:hypothetical protein
MAKPKSKTKKSNGVAAKKSNGVPAAAKPNGVPVVATLPAYGPPQIDPSIGQFRAMKQEMEAEIRNFRDYIVAKYKDFNGRDMRKDVAWYMEQMGTGIASDMEREKREARVKLIEETRKSEAAGK